MICKNCGKNVPQNNEICPHCNEATGFLKNLNGKQRLDSLSILNGLDMISTPRTVKSSVGKIKCTQCGYLNDNNKENCTLCGCVLQKPTAPVTNNIQTAVNNETQSEFSFAALLANPDSRKKLIIGGIVAAEVLLVIIVIAVFTLFSGSSGTPVNGNSSAVSLKYVETSTQVSSQESSGIVSYQTPSASGLDLSALLTSEEILAMQSSNAALQSSSQAMSSNTYNIIIPYAPTQSTQQSSTAMQSTVQESSKQQSSAPSESSKIQESSKPTSSVKPQESSKPTSSVKPQTSSVSQTSSKVTSSARPVEPDESNEPVASEEEPVNTSSEDSSIAGDGAYD